MSTEDIRREVQWKYGVDSASCANCKYRNDMLGDRDRGTFCERWHCYMSDYSICRLWRHESS